MRLIRLCRRIEVTAIPEAARPQVTSSNMAATRPIRIGNPRGGFLAIPVVFALAGRLARLPQHIAHAAQGVQQSLFAGIDLAAQI
ncbi:Uncharacterised protein [Mycobacterium tuberculosis]|nr:Uncharacterised protein [Mycobacterium tuberculosis]